MAPLELVIFTILTAISVVSGSSLSLDHRCRCIPGDACWPSAKQWDRLNSTLQGRLIATSPLARVCHGHDYNQESCNELKTNWDLPETHMYVPGEFDAPYWQTNETCNPFTPINSLCTLGNFASYSINVSKAEDIISGFEFAQVHNVRVVVKNTGHDYLGKSTGKGSLAFWTANLKGSTLITQYTSKQYKGPALKIGAGMTAGEVYQAAYSLGYRFVGGECPTVGLAGGYSQGGGHSPLQSIYGMGADNVLEWEVVTPTGEHITATPDGPHADLYWALSGGGGGTFGVVLSMTSRIHEDGPVGGANLTIVAADNTQASLDALWEVVDYFHANELGPIVDKGITLTYSLTNVSFGFYAATAPDQTGAYISDALASFTRYLDAAGITYELANTTSASYYEHMDYYFGPMPLGRYPIAQLTGGRLIPRATVLGGDAPRQKLISAFRDITKNGDYYLAFTASNLELASAAGNVNTSRNAVLPTWRSSILHVITVSPWDLTLPREKFLTRQDELTGTVMPLLEAATPGSGSYLNEANFQQPNWQKEFYGVNYARLSDIKAKVDPLGLMYGRTAVGSDKWAEDAEGRLCRI